MYYRYFKYSLLFELLLEKGKWETVEVHGSPPSPRTCHIMASVGSKFYVFGGGLSGPDPVPDTNVHVFNAGEIYTEVLQNLVNTSLYNYILSKHASFLLKFKTLNKPN